jgi:hypothetical protein
MRPLVVGLALFALSFVASGCFERVLIDDAPPIDAAYAERSAYYEAHAPAGKSPGAGLFLMPSTAGRASSPIALPPGPQVLALRDGTIVERAEDLLPAVDERSSAAASMQRAERWRAGYQATMWSGALVCTAGAVVGLGALPFLGDPQTEGPAGIAAVAGISTLAAGMVATTLASVFVELGLDLAQDEAFNAYEAALVQRLALNDDPARKKDAVVKQHAPDDVVAPNATPPQSEARAP